jgi:hypothetical protein
MLTSLAESCQQCQRRKLRCDRQLPCKPCKRSRNVLRCTYSDATQNHRSFEGIQVGEQPSPTGSPSAASRDNAREARRTSDPLITTGSTAGAAQPFVNQNSDPTVHSLQANSGDSKFNASRDLVDSVRDLRIRLKRLEKQISAPSIANDTSPEFADLSPQPHLRGDAEHRLRLYGRSHWLHTLDNVRVCR